MGTHVIQNLSVDAFPYRLKSYLKIYQARYKIYYNRFKILMYDIYEYKFNISCYKTTQINQGEGIC